MWVMGEEAIRSLYLNPWEVDFTSLLSRPCGILSYKPVLGGGWPHNMAAKVLTHPPTISQPNHSTSNLGARPLP